MRYQRTLRAFIKTLQKAGLKFALLGAAALGGDLAEAGKEGALSEGAASVAPGAARGLVADADAGLGVLHGPLDRVEDVAGDGALGGDGHRGGGTDDGEPAEGDGQPALARRTAGVDGQFCTTDDRIGKLDAFSFESL